MLKYSEFSLSQLPYLELFLSVGGWAFRAFFGGASQETFSGEAELKKSERPIDALAVKKKVNYSLSDNLASRDASASKNHPVIDSKLTFSGWCDRNYYMYII